MMKYSIRIAFQVGFTLSAFFCFIFCLSSCNPYSVVDKPSGDLQLLTAARACFDSGDFSCASTYYSKVSSASSDEGYSESAFLELTQNGATSTVFLNAAIHGSGGGGQLITKIANGVIPNVGESTRLAYFNAYKKASSIQDPYLKGLVQFTSSLAILGEILGENASEQGIFRQSDFVSDPTECLANPPTGCGSPANKKIITGTQIGTGASPTLANATDAQLSGAPTLYMFNAAIGAAQEGLNNLNTNGNLGSNSSAFNNTILNNASVSLQAGVDSPLYRYLLIKNGIGE